MDFKPGQHIRHAKYGSGTIVSRDDQRTVVDFDDAGMKKFVTAMAVFEHVEGEVPAKKRTPAKRKAAAKTARKAAAKTA